MRNGQEGKRKGETGRAKEKREEETEFDMIGGRVWRRRVD